MILRILQFAIGLFGATFLFWAGIAWEHRPAGFASFDLQVLGPFHLRHADPGGPFVQLAALKAAEQAAGVRAARIEAADQQAIAAIGAQDEAARRRIETVTRTIVKEIPIALPPAVDRRFPLSVGFVRLHDAAARGALLSDVAAPAGAADDAASLVPPSDLAGVIAANYGDCRADAAELADWQAWYAALRAARDVR
jgi:hypothetical protein